MAYTLRQYKGSEVYELCLDGKNTGVTFGIGNDGLYYVSTEDQDYQTGFHSVAEAQDFSESINRLLVSSENLLLSIYGDTSNILNELY